jgi:two-component system capsular synthesis sensor histidine kinase RcsC
MKVNAGADDILLLMMTASAWQGRAVSSAVVISVFRWSVRRGMAAQRGDAACCCAAGRIYRVELEDRKARPRCRHRTREARNDDMMILVVDDHPINRRLLADQLGSLGYQCKTANDGVDALNVLSKNHIDIVLSDVNMPNMDGYRLTQRIRELGLTLPVIGVTANALAEEKQRCLESGMDSCLSKPVTLDVLKQTLAVYARG